MTTIFRNNKTQAVRLPKAVAFPGKAGHLHVAVVRDGDRLDKLNRYGVQLLNQRARMSAELENRRVAPTPSAALKALVAE